MTDRCVAIAVLVVTVGTWVSLLVHHAAIVAALL